jgi:hypothetical protein
MADKRDQNQKSLQRWNNEGGAPKGGRARRPRDPNQLAKSIVDIATGQADERKPESTKNQAAAELGRKGGKARAESMSAEKRAQIAKRAAESRWKDSNR